MEIAALPVPVFPFGITPNAKESAQDAARQQGAGTAIGLPGSSRKGGLPDEVVLQGEILRKDQYTYSRPKSSGSDLQGEAFKEQRRAYTHSPVDSYTIRTAINAYQENTQSSAATLSATDHIIDVFV